MRIFFIFISSIFLCINLLGCSKVDDSKSLSSSTPTPPPAEEIKDMDWYVVQASFNSCRLEKEGPASTIELSQKFLKKTPETFDEKTIGGVVVNVKVKFGNGFVEYIRGKERCEETLKARAGEKKEELDSYKNKYK